MPSPHLMPETASDAWNLFENYLQENNSSIRPLVQTALFRYTLPGYGFTAGGKSSEAREFMKRLPIRQLVDALDIQQNVFDHQQTKLYAQRANRHRLKQFLEWCQQQDWWKPLTQGKSCAPRRRNQLGNAHHAKLVTRRNPPAFSLQNLPADQIRTRWQAINPERAASLTEAEITLVAQAQQRLQRQIDQLHKFQVSIQYRYRQDPAVREDTAKKTEKQIYLIMGWLYFIEGMEPTQLELERLNDVDLAYDYTEWQRSRNLCPKTEMQALAAILAAAKFLNHRQSDQKYCDLMTKAYVDIEIIGELRKLIRDTNQRIKAAPTSVADESQKWLDWPEYLACVDYLRKDCALLTSDGARRSNRAIAHSYERYLLAALLAYMPPDRQRTFRELQLGQTLVRGTIKNNIFYAQADGSFYISLTGKDYKTGDAYGDHIQPVPDCLTEPLAAWLTQWRSVLQPTHDFVFSQLNGKPLTRESLYQLFRHAIYRASIVLFGQGRATNPHLVRDMLVTYMYQTDASEAVMDGLAIGMKHSRQTQRQSYDRRTKQDKLAPALRAIQSLAPVVIPPKPFQVVPLEPIHLVVEANEAEES